MASMTDSFSKISSMLESAKDLTIEAAVSASSRLTDTPSASRPKEISNLLSSRVERDILNGMKCVISIISRGEDGLPYFADVVKNITTPNTKIKNLVLIYLTRYADIEPDTALLSINSIQKSLNDKNPINRAKSIRALSGIKIASIVPILMLCIKRTITDPSPLVRSATAIAIGKVFDIHTGSKKQLLEYISKLIADSDAQVVSSSIKTYYKIKDEFGNTHKIWEPIHGNFRRLCSLMNDLDEWSQCFLIDILIEYSRKFLPKPKLFFIDDVHRVIDLPDDFKDMPQVPFEVSFDSDLELFLNSLRSLMYSRNDGVILNAVKALFFLAPPKTLIDFEANFALLRITKSSNSSQTASFVWQIISYISAYDRTIFGQFYKQFYVYPTDSAVVAKSKLQILSSLTDELNIKYILEELKYYALHSTNIAISRAAIRTIGSCAQLSSDWNRVILNWCLKQMHATSGFILNELITVVRFLIQQKNSFKDNIANEREVIMKTCHRLSNIIQDQNLNIASDAKGSIIWIIGEFTVVCENQIGPDVLRGLIKTFSKEEESVRYQILVLAAKICTFELKQIKSETGDFEEAFKQRMEDNISIKMFQFVLQLSKYDDSYDTRDRARMFNILLNSGKEQAELASLFLQVPKPVPVSQDATVKQKELIKVLSNFFSVSEWSEAKDLPNAKIRTPAVILHNKLASGSGISFTSSATYNKSVSPPIMSSHSISSEQFSSSTRGPTFEAKKQPAYQLQSLDEFFGGNEDDDGDDDDDEEDDDEEDEEDDEEDDHEDEDEDSDDDSSDEGNESDELDESNSDLEDDVRQEQVEHGNGQYADVQSDNSSTEAFLKH